MPPTRRPRPEPTPGPTGAPDLVTQPIATRGPNHRGRAAAAVIGSGVLFGTSGTASVLLHTGASPMAIAAVRLIVGSIGLVVLAVRQRELGHLVALWRRGTTWLMGVAAAAYMGTFFLAVGAGGVAIASLVSISLGPLFSALIARALGRPWPGRVWLVATILAVGGVALLGWPADAGSSTGAAGAATAPGSDRLLGAIFATVSSASYSLYAVLGSKLTREEHHATDALAAAFAIGSVILLPFLVMDASWLASPQGIGLALWTGLVTTTTSYALFGYGFTHLAPGIVATLVLSEPVVATLLGVGVLGEPMPMRGWIGCAAIAVGLALVARNEARGAGQEGAGRAPAP